MEYIFELLEIRFHTDQIDHLHALAGSYSLTLVALSYTFAVAGSYVGLLIAPRITAGRTHPEKIAWLIAGAAAMGGGVWSMHFIGMLAIHGQMEMTFDAFMTALSLLPSFFASAVVLHLLSREEVKQLHLVLGGALTGAGIGAMHFIGMAAMRMNATIVYDPYLFALSIVVAVVLAIFALTVKLWIEQVSGIFHRRWANLICAAVMGAAISGMHYTAMKAATFFPGDMPTLTGLAIDNDLMVILANGFVLVLMIFVALAAIAHKAWASSALVKLIIDNSAEGFLVYDSKGAISLFSPGAETMFGLPSEDVIGTNVSVLLPGEAMTPTTNRVSSSAPNEEATVDREVMASDNMGREFPLEIAIARVMIGDEMTFCATLRDITARKEVDRVRDSAHRELAEALETQKKANQLQRDFVTMASHEFRTPLTIIDGAAQRIQRRIDSVSASELDLESKVKKIRGGVSRMQQLMESFLAAAKSELGSIELSVSAVDFGQILTKVCLEMEACDTKHKIDVKLEDFPETSNVDPGLMTQVISNLISNATKYSPANDRVEVRAWACPDHIYCSVRDFGVGIPADELEKVSSRFFRASTSSGIPGTGIGLNLTRHIVERHGGALGFESQVGEGTVVTVTIPR